MELCRFRRSSWCEPCLSPFEPHRTASERPGSLSMIPSVQTPRVSRWTHHAKWSYTTQWALRRRSCANTKVQVYRARSLKRTRDRCIVSLGKAPEHSPLCWARLTVVCRGTRERGSGAEAGAGAPPGLSASYHHKVNGRCARCEDSTHALPGAETATTVGSSFIPSGSGTCFNLQCIRHVSDLFRSCAGTERTKRPV